MVITPFSRRPGLFSLLTTAALVLGLLALPAVAASLSASLDRSELALNQTLELTLRYDSRDPVGQPDLGALAPHFEVLGQTQSRQLRITNSRTQSYTQWQYRLAPKTQGRILIPAFELGGARSQPLEVVVKPPRFSPNRPDGDYFLERTLEPETAYAGQQLHLSVRLHTAVDLADMRLTPLEVENARVLELEGRRYQRRLNGRDYLVHEKNYALFPRESGSLRVPAQRLTARRGTRGSLFDLDRSPQVRLRAEPLTLEVEAPPRARGWLPAVSLKIQQRLLGKGPFAVGEPITLERTLEAEGADPARLPSLNLPEMPGVKVYPEPPKNEQATSARGLVSTVTRRFTLVPTQAGRLDIPAPSVRWWNSETREPVQATAEPLSLEVTAPAVASGQARELQDDASAAPPEDAKTASASPASSSKAVAPPPASAPVSAWWLWSQLGWALLCAALGWGWWRARRAGDTTGKAPEPGSPKPADTSAAREALRQACQAHDPAATRQALLAWAEARDLLPAPANLSAVQALAGDDLQGELERLDKALYAPHQNVQVDFDGLYQKAIQLHAGRNQEAQKEARDGALKRLYP